MEREKRKRNSRKYIRLLIIVISSYNLVFATPSLINIEYFPKVARISDTFTIKFYMDSRLNESAKIVLNDDGALLLETSNIFIENAKTIIENQYKIKKTGILKLNNILVYVKNYVIEVPPIELEVQSNPLSKDTQFRIKIFEYKKIDNIAKKNLNEHELKLPFILGKKYFILIEGLFEKTEEQKISVQYELPDNAFIEKLKTYPLEFMEDATWKPVSIFLWIPLKRGMQILPQFNLVLDINKTQEYKLALEEVKVEILAMEQSKLEKDNLKEGFQNTLTKILKEEKTFKQYTNEEIEIAKKIKELREKEYNSFFYANLQKKRKELEKKLGLENTFTVFHYKPYIMSIVIAVIFLSYPICKKIIYKKILKNKTLKIYDILSFCVGILILIYTINMHDPRKEYTITDTMINVRITPDKNSTVLEDTSIGQTVKIIHFSKDWYFVETIKNIRGWMQKEKNK